ncbi:uncharacterized protein MAM_05541 [Metarhizium album ARSEF 1941]|uniref:Rhodopsin domain-containing protein n=1 Tax=Metarhizium album (strain ARSEF 1941) TaxID=1081103 RepID=A0A0B2WRF3_METAS|nr:uncharacterized protein MAM_05541 [Metarhizium album ARSEF 1941]KHN96598.1 hypothetical protein MAM_05541 [Metarhizium album ARSEF 1941]
MSLSSFTAEAWTEYALGLCILVARILCRVNVVGRRWDGDDYFAVLAAILWTAELCTLQLIEMHGSLKDVKHRVVLKLSEEEKSSIVFGAKCAVATWCIYVSLIWTLKACMLFLYGRLTLDLKQRQLVKTTAVVCAAAYVATIAVVWLHCTPIRKKWQIHPYPGDACAKGTPVHYTLVVTNVSTDLMIMAIPLPLLWKVQMPRLRKLLCGVWLCTGGFIMLAAIVRFILCIKHATSTDLTTVWSLRETFVGLIAANIPILGPWMVRAARHLPVARSRDGSKGSDARGALGPPPGGHKLSRLERQAKENRIRRGLGWATIDTGSREPIVKAEAESHLRSPLGSGLSGSTANGTASSEHCTLEMPKLEVPSCDGSCVNDMECGE